MVARPPLRVLIEPMRIDDLPAVHAIEQASFDAPWPPEAYRNDLETNRLAQYLVARVGDEIAAYPDDRPYASRLLLGWRDRQPLYVVAT